jgi:tetratricopeptide (TPR) repeat protein
MKHLIILFLSLFFISNPAFASLNSRPSTLGELNEPITIEGKLQKTIEWAQEKIEEEPKNYKHYFTLAFLYDRAGLYQEEAEALKNEIKYYPDDEEGKEVPYGNLARTYLILNRLDRAKQALDKAMEINPKNPINQMHLVQYYLEKKKFLQSISAKR